jgi:hypothetical protein
MIQVLNVQKQITKRNRNFTLQKLFEAQLFHKQLQIISIIKLSLILSFWNLKA